MRVVFHVLTFVAGLANLTFLFDLRAVVNSGCFRKGATDSDDFLSGHTKNHRCDLSDGTKRFLRGIIFGWLRMVINNEKSIAGILIENYDEIVKRLRWRMGGVVDPDDVVQDAFLKLHALPADVKIGNPRSYVFRVADNTALDLIRSRKARSRYFSSEEMRDSASEAPSPERITDFRQRLRILEKIVSEMPPRQREVFLLHKFDELSHADIAQRLGISRSAVEKHIMKALVKCRERLDSLLDQGS